MAHTYKTIVITDGGVTSIVSCCSSCGHQQKAGDKPVTPCHLADKTRKRGAAIPADQLKEEISGNDAKLLSSIVIDLTSDQDAIKSEQLPLAKRVKVDQDIPANSTAVISSGNGVDIDGGSSSNSSSSSTNNISSSSSSNNSSSSSSSSSNKNGRSSNSNNSSSSRNSSSSNSSSDGSGNGSTKIGAKSRVQENLQVSGAAGSGATSGDNADSQDTPVVRVASVSAGAAGAGHRVTKKAATKKARKAERRAWKAGAGAGAGAGVGAGVGVGASAAKRFIPMTPEAACAAAKKAAVRARVAEQGAQATAAAGREAASRAAKNSQNQMNWNGGEYCGELVCDKPYGYGTHTDTKSGKKYSGQWINGKFHGLGVWEFEGDVYAGEFLNNARQGRGVYQYNKSLLGQANDVDMYAGSFVAGKFFGYGVETARNGDRYEGEVVKNGKEGMGEMAYASGASYKGSFKRDQWWGRRDTHMGRK